MPLALVIEPVRVPLGKDPKAYRTVGPRYKAEGDKKFKICPQVEIPDKHFDAYRRAGHVRRAIGKKSEIIFTGSHKNWQPVDGDVAFDQEPGFDADLASENEALKARNAELEAQLAAQKSDDGGGDEKKGAAPEKNRKADAAKIKTK